MTRFRAAIGRSSLRRPEGDDMNFVLRAGLATPLLVR